MSERINFGTIKEGIEPPNLIEVQLNSYVEFLQKDVPSRQAEELRLQAVFKEVFPIESYDEKATLDFSHYEIGEPKLSALEAQREGQTFSAPLHVTFQLKEEKGTKEEKVYMGEIPLMTPQGTFVINGAERVVVSASCIVRPASLSSRRIHLNGKVLYSFRIIPDRGSWIEVQFDTSDLLYVYLDRRKRRRKFLATTFLRALGYGTDEEVLKLFYNIEKLKLSEKLDEEELATKVLIADVLDGEVDRGARLRAADRRRPSARSWRWAIKEVKVIDISNDDTVIKALKKDPAHDEEEALKDIYRRLRPGDPPTVANARALLKRLFFDPKRYDLGRVGRYKINQKLGINVDLGRAHPDRQGFHRRDQVSDQPAPRRRHARRHRSPRQPPRPHGGRIARQPVPRRSRPHGAPGEGAHDLVRLNIDGMTPQKLINPKALSAVIRDFFGRSQLSQFMDQTNPLAELTHKRRLSALGPGGLEPRSRGLRSPRRASVALRPHLPDRNAGRSEHRSHQLDEHLRAHQRIRLHRNALSQGRERPRDRSSRLPHRRSRRELHRRAGQCADRRRRAISPAKRFPCRYRGDFLEVEPSQGPLHGRLAEAARLGGGGADSVPRT